MSDETDAAGEGAVRHAEAIHAISPNTPVYPWSDLDTPDFAESMRVHDWRNHVPSDIVDAWPRLSLDARAVAYIMAQAEADREEWE